MGIAGITRLITWETDTVLGISKTTFRKNITTRIFDLCNITKQEQSKIDTILSAEHKNEVESANAKTLYEEPKKNRLISPFEAQRRLRYFSEEYLNKEFDIFMSLLPNLIISNYLSKFFSIDPNSVWNIIGSSNDFEQSTGISFMYMDTLAYSHATKTLIALELKMDSDIGKNQLLKYMFMKAYLEDIGMIATDTKFEILILGPSKNIENKIPYLLEDTRIQLAEKNYPKKRVSKEQMENLLPFVKKLIEETNIRCTSWQDFGDYFYEVKCNTSNHGNSETLYKLIDGFLSTLNQKFSRKHNTTIYKSP
jgi:hypothetical protein